MPSFSRLVRLLTFYGIFYTILTTLTAVYFKLFLTTLNDQYPKWQLESSLIGTNPGLTIRPADSFFNITNISVPLWTKELDSFLAPYLSTTKSDNVQTCYYENEPDEGKVCDFKLDSGFVPCLPQYGYGLDLASKGLCVFLKLNKIYGWTPEFYHRDNAPLEMPEEVLEMLKKGELVNQYKIWVDCVSVTSSADLGSVKYYPEAAFHGKYFPYKNFEGYLSPLVAVHFENPQRGVLINVECRAWAVNIQRDRRNNRGVVQFSLYID